MPHASSQSRKAWTPLVKALKVRTGVASRSLGTAATSSVLPMSMPPASACVFGLSTAWPAWQARARFFVRRWRLLIVTRGLICLTRGMKCLTGPPPKKVGQSPERGPRSLRPGATNDRLAGVATRLTIGVAARGGATIGRTAYTPVRRIQPSARRMHARANVILPPAKATACSFANHALQRTRPSRPCCNRSVPRAGSLSFSR